MAKRYKDHLSECKRKQTQPATGCVASLGSPNSWRSASWGQGMFSTACSLQAGPGLVLSLQTRIQTQVSQDLPDAQCWRGGFLQSLGSSGDPNNAETRFPPTCLLRAAFLCPQNWSVLQGLLKALWTPGHMPVTGCRVVVRRGPWQFRKIKDQGKLRQTYLPDSYCV